MPNYKQSMELFEKLLARQDVARKLLNDVVNARGLVRFLEICAFHEIITSKRHGFVLRENATEYVLPGGRQLFYVNAPVLVRVKTTGTERRPRPHMTVSLSENRRWEGEAAKFNRQGVLVPRVGPVSTASAQGQWRALLRVDDPFASDDRWANDCHFDFVPGFDGSAAHHPGSRLGLIPGRVDD